MTNEQLIEKFHPDNAVNLTPEDLELMRSLSDEQIGVLAKAYPNQPGRRTYIRLYDKAMKPDKQIYQNTTWQNLNNLRKYSNKKNLIPYDFKTVNSRVNQVKSAKATLAAPKKVVVDLSAKEAAEELTKTLQKTKKPKEDFTEKMKAAKEAKKADTKKEVPADQDFGE